MSSPIRWPLCNIQIEFLGVRPRNKLRLHEQSILGTHWQDRVQNLHFNAILETAFGIVFYHQAFFYLLVHHRPTRPRTASHAASNGGPIRSPSALCPVMRPFFCNLRVVIRSMKLSSSSWWLLLGDVTSVWFHSIQPKKCRDNFPPFKLHWP